MNSASCIIVVMFVFLVIAIISFGIYSLRIAQKTIFSGSGAPISMAQMLLSSIHVTSQILLGVLIIAIVSLLISNQVVTSEAGLPVLSVISGYLLGKSFKDVAPGRQAKSNP